MSEQELRRQLDEILECLRGPIKDAGNGGLAGMVRDLQRDMKMVKDRLTSLEAAHPEPVAHRPISKVKAAGWLSTLGALAAWAIDALLRKGGQ